MELGEGRGARSLALLPGMSAGDVEACLRAAAGAAAGEELVLRDAGGAVVPISAALPAETRVEVELRRRRPILRRSARSALGAMNLELAASTQAMKKTSQETNRLANHISVLAWNRTSLALCRTAFAAATLKAYTRGWLAALDFVNLSLIVLAALFYVTGTLRCADVEDALDRDTPPLYMLEQLAGDKGMWRSMRQMAPVHLWLGVTLIAVAADAPSGGFVKD